MGCWNETCGITQIPIQSGDPVALVLIGHVGDHNRDHAGSCYINEQWSPKFLPIFGSYNDYGGLQDIQQDWNTQFILEQLRQDLAETRLTATREPIKLPHVQRELDTLDLDTMTLEDVLKQIHQDRIWVPGYYGLMPLGWMMVHAWVWDHMTERMDRNWLDTLDLAQVVQQVRDYYQAMVSYQLQAMQDNTENKFMLQDYRYRKLDVSHTNCFYPLMDRGYQLDESRMINGITAYNDRLWKLVESGLKVNDPQVRAVIDHMARFLTFRANMTAMRKQWSPQTGKGGQHANLEMHLALHKLAACKIEQKLAQDWEDDDEGADDD